MKDDTITAGEDLRVHILEDIRKHAQEQREETKAKARSRKKDRRRRRRRRKKEGTQPKDVTNAMDGLSLTDDDGDGGRGGSSGECKEEQPGEALVEQEQEEEEEEVCAICTMPLNEDEEEVIKTLICGHCFHGVTCLDLWRARCWEKQIPATCPVCRGSLEETES